MFVLARSPSLRFPANRRCPVKLHIKFASLAVAAALAGLLPAGPAVAGLLKAKGLAPAV